MFLTFHASFARRRIGVLLRCLMCVPAAAFASPTVMAGDLPEPGRRTVRFEQPAPLTTPAEMRHRMGGRPPSGFEEIDLAEERSHVLMPRVEAAAEPAAKPWGLFVFIHPGGDGRLHRPWLDVLARHRLIWIGPDEAGNDRDPWSRVRLALQAAHSMCERYPGIDRRRVYVAGVSGGGRIASITAMLWPDVFRGGVYMVGSNYFRHIPSPAQPDAYYRATFPRPRGKAFELTRDRSRHVLLTGEQDGNRDQTLGNYKFGYQRDRFSHVTYLEVPGMGHATPPAAWLEKAIEALDAPIMPIESQPPRGGDAEEDT